MTSKTATAEIRAKAARMRAEAARREARRRGIVRSLLVLGVVGAVVAVVVGVQLSHTSDLDTSAAPANLVDGGVLAGDPSAGVTITIYEDFLCPACQGFEEENREQMAAWAADGTAKVLYRPIAILDRASTDGYSTRAVAAAAAVIDTTPDAYPAFSQALFDEQPAEGGPGLSNDRLADLAVQAGAPDSVRDAIADQRFAGWAAVTTEEASQSGVTGTPTVLVNGQQLADRSPAGLLAAVTAAQP